MSANSQTWAIWLTLCGLGHACDKTYHLESQFLDLYIFILWRAELVVIRHGRTSSAS